MFLKCSRYEKVETLEFTGLSGEIIPYIAVRFVGTAEPEAHYTHLVSQGERLDHIAYRYYQDPERFWRICDANLALWPPDLLEREGEENRLLIPPSAEQSST